MAERKASPNGGPRSFLAYGTLIFSALAITVLAVIAILSTPSNTMTIFNIVLPVFASWVGTILAFYFGRENFESANQQVRELVQRLTPEQRAKALVTSIMRKLSDTVSFQIPAGKTDKDIKISDLKGKYSDKVTRLPVIDSEKRPQYIIHESVIMKYIASGGKPDDTLETFLTAQKQAGVGFEADEGFVLVSEQTTLADAKRKLEEKARCQDIFITKGGGGDEALTGWISNVRLAKFLEP